MTLVTYFSASGVTKSAAEKLANKLSADIFEIVPTERYTDADLNWHDKNSRSSVEMNDKNSRPQIADSSLELNRYDEIYIGFPIWWYTAPTIINTFLEKYDFSGKTIHLFATSGGSTIAKSVKDLQSTYPQYNIKDGKMA